MTVYEYVNLTRGLLCPHLSGIPDVHYVRIQSTWCEQKRWGDIITSLGADFYYRLAVGGEIRVHDVSEKPRTPRAMWQGLPWVRFACVRAWCDKELPTYSRNGMDVTAYFSATWRGLGDRERKAVTYYRQHYTGGLVELSSCAEVAA